MEDRDYWMLFGLIVLVAVRVQIQGMHLRLLSQHLLSGDRLASEALGG
jgi:hypothetical protein